MMAVANTCSRPMEFATPVTLTALEPTLLAGHIPPDPLVRAPDRTQADRSFSRHQASEDSSQTCTRRERTFIMSAKRPIRHVYACVHLETHCGYERHLQGIGW